MPLESICVLYSLGMAEKILLLTDKHVELIGTLTEALQAVKGT